MKVTQLRINSFRNISRAELACNHRFNIVHGANGQGKTNLLEAIFLLGSLKSFRQARTGDLIAWQEPEALLRGSVEAGGVERQIAMHLGRQGKQVTVDNKSVNRLVDFFGVLNVVAFSPEEIFMVRGSPDNRRRYLDRAVFCGDVTYLSLHHAYAKVLKNRNQLLRQRDYRGLEAWTEQLALAGSRLIMRRHAFVEEIAPLFSRFYREITGSDEEAVVCYHPHPAIGRDQTTGVAELLRQALVAGAAAERERGTTLVGPHRDDLDFFMDGKLLRLHGSQGQLRSFVLALKMAEIEHLRSTAGAPPVLLLDDMTAELDRKRNLHLQQFLADHDMQVFITTTDPTAIPLIDAHHCSTFRVEKGSIVS